ncbi:peptide chain release factor 3 [Kineococcus xinjiangensis]|uniref:Peptide chain release factor 3 n=1 Tax=Kineococcus xinjiangensis TaxID=512762 RepID=A0A2S6IMP6_9ACTN|nr:peptide chain release factor 3 [Kineococcus xinjiangensis]PPK95426.1 peptide chain release factor 3 [Kineococcus xinjiangensis]
MSRGPDAPHDVQVGVASEAARRRTLAIISHPDAGKSTLTEALALHAHAIRQAGHVHGKAGRAGVVSDWQEMEKARGISISSAVLQLHHEGHVLNVLDTPGHADFSEDTYRVLAAVDSAIMLVDAARGMERQTRKLFEVCRHRRIPVITVVNKWDRPGLEALAVLDDIAAATGLRPTPLNWPVGIAGDFRGLLDTRRGDYVRFTRTPGGASLALSERMDAATAAREEGAAWAQAQEEAELLAVSGGEHDREAFLGHESTPVLFTAAVVNFGVAQVLDALAELAPAPTAQRVTGGGSREVDDPFSAQIFKIQAGMNPAHRDRLAFARIHSGCFQRGMTVVNARTQRPLVLKHVQTVFGSDRQTVDEAWPGDVIGLVNATHIQVGDTLAQAPVVAFPPIPAFAPEHFGAARALDLGKAKQFRQGLAALDAEGVVQVLHSDRRGHGEPVLAAVGPLQYEVAVHRMAHEFHAPLQIDPLPYSVARRVDTRHATLIDSGRGSELVVRSDGQALALFLDEWRLGTFQRAHPDVELLPVMGAD